jgi:single-strand DNA-binding protein
MAGDTPITVVGNLTSDPELRFTPSGAAVANFTVASTPRSFDRQTNEWKDQETLFLNCSVWRQAAENAAESLTRGMRVIVQGRLKARSYETREGEKRTVFEIDVEEVGPSLRSATAKVSKTSRSGGGQGFQSGGGDDPWASNQGAGNQGGQSGGQPGGQSGGSWGGQQGGGQQGGGQTDPWATSGGAGGSSDEPPF